MNLTDYHAKYFAYLNLTVKKIPKSVLTRCEWGHDDYSLKVENLPKAPSVAEAMEGRPPSAHTADPSGQMDLI